MGELVQSKIFKDYCDLINGYMAAFENGAIDDGQFERLCDQALELAKHLGSLPKRSKMSQKGIPGHDFAQDVEVPEDEIGENSRGDCD